MPQNDRTTSAPVSPVTSEARTDTVRTDPVAGSAPRLDTIGSTISNPAVSPDRETPDVTADSLNAGVGAEARAAEGSKEDKPAKKGPLSIEELQEKRRMGLLTVDEAKQLNDAENAPKSDATVKQLTDNDREIKDPDKNSFKEGDVIDYMYNHWLIDGAMYLDQKIRKYGAYGFERMMAATREHRAEKRAEKARIENSSTNKSAEKIEKQHKEREEKIVAQSKEKADDIFRISQVIQAGTLFDPKNKELLDKFDEINKSNTPEGQERRQQLEAAAQKLKEHPDDKEQQQQMKRDAATFARDANINNRFDTQIQITANDMTAANMLDSVARNKDAFPNGIEAAYDSQMTTNTDAVMTATAEKREKALATIDEVDKNSAAALRAGSYGIQAAQMINRQWEQEAFGDFEKIQDYAKDAGSRSLDDITHGRVQEFEKEPKENKSLNKMNNYVADRLPEDYVPVKAEEKTATATEQRNSDEKKPVETENNGEAKPVDYSNAAVGSSLPKDKPVIINGDETLDLAGYKLDLSRPENKTKLDAMNNGDAIVVGRDADEKGIPIAYSHEAVSRKHLIIEKVDGKLVVTDLSSNGTKIAQKPKETSHSYTKDGVREHADKQEQTPPPVITTAGLENNGGKSGTVRDEAALQQNNDARITETRTTISDKQAGLQAREAQHEERGNAMQDRIARIKARAQSSTKNQTGEYMVDTMTAEGNISKGQEEALLNAGINESKGKGETSEERVLDHMIQSGKFSEKQLDIALTAAIERQRYTKG